jgi:uncharacterized protein YwqG
MKTGPAVALSMVIAFCVVAVLGTIGYLAARRIAVERDRVIAARLPPDEDRAAKQAAWERAAAVLAPAQAALDASARPALKLELTAMAGDDPLASKVGGRAYWEARRAYPVDAAGKPLHLLAQLDFAALRLKGYPTRGMLQFFIAADDYYGANFDAPRDGDWMGALSRQKNFRVVYWPDPRVDAAVSPPQAALAKQDALPFDPASPRRLVWLPKAESIGGSDVHFESIVGASVDALVERYVSAHREAKPDLLEEAVRERLQRFGSKLGGYPDFTQEDPRRSSDRQVLLLQLDSDDGMMWGDSGIANFFIDPDDLARADFSRVAYHWDCY